MTFPFGASRLVRNHSTGPWLPMNAYFASSTSISGRGVRTFDLRSAMYTRFRRSVP